ncbi:transcription factor UNE12 [Amborella trichopoda]|uniref:transcription factor UNE12 n=1 Tax=Amborella trichopoda TaxID=13333 RepID=UPI0009BF99A5|nr:transcription factor UNE12 [Amborella trichopoda]|eukprot:XP_020520122.1 transcription factor UNE12 [Amborella trichopoda]
MANAPEKMMDEFLEQILAIPAYAAPDGNFPANQGGFPAANHMVLQLGSGESSGHGSGFSGPVFPLGLGLEHGKSCFAKPEAVLGADKRFRDEHEGKGATKAEHFGGLFPVFGGVHSHSLRPEGPQAGQGMALRQGGGYPQQGSSATSSGAAAAPHPPAVRPRVRARRGQATDPHSIAERVAGVFHKERNKVMVYLCFSLSVIMFFLLDDHQLTLYIVLLQTDRAAMLDEILEYVKFLRLQVKVLSMSRMGGAGAVAQLVADIPLPADEGDGSGCKEEQAWERWSTEGTEREVAKLMEEDVGAAMQFLQSKALCLMPIALASTLYHTRQGSTSSSDGPTSRAKPEPNSL